MRSRFGHELALALDPGRFARERCGWTPDPWQERALSLDRPILMLCCSRQSGKSTTIALKAAHRAIYQPGATIVLVAPALRQCAELMRTTKAFLSAAKAQLTGDNVMSAMLTSGSRILSVPAREDTIRGIAAVDLLIEDEAAWVPDAVHRAMQPMLAVRRGQLVMMSTPYGKRGHFFELFSAEDPNIARVEVPWTECPRLDRHVIEAERVRYGRAYVAQEYECRFVETDDAVFRHDDIVRALDPTIPALAFG